MRTFLEFGLCQVQFSFTALNSTAPSASIESASFPASDIHATHEAVYLLPYPHAPIPSSSNCPFSLGQCQLISLTCALRHSRILVMDEATASVDIGMHKMIQQVAMGLHCTVIIIAHRLDTVEGCDRVVVLER